MKASPITSVKNSCFEHIFINAYIHVTLPQDKTVYLFNSSHLFNIYDVYDTGGREKGKKEKQQQYIYC